MLNAATTPDYLYLNPASVPDANTRVGIGTQTPEFKLSLDNDGGIIAKGTYGSGAILTTSGAGSRLIWYPNKAAFRAGSVGGDAWDNTNIGDVSIGLGIDARASGRWSLAFGTQPEAAGQDSIAIGRAAYASAIGSIAISNCEGAVEPRATGTYSVAIGEAVEASAAHAFVLGRGYMGSPITYLNNNIANSFMIGAGSNVPTLYIDPNTALGESGKVGIGTTSIGSAKLKVVGGDIAITTQPNGLVLRESNGANCRRITVNASGTISASAAFACP